jgi:hypothetical protein
LEMIPPRIYLLDARLSCRAWVSKKPAVDMGCTVGNLSYFAQKDDVEYFFAWYWRSRLSRGKMSSGSFCIPCFIGL